MAIWLTRGDGDGCISVCAACATLDEVTDTSMRELAVGKWGPIPKRNTDRTYPCPRVVGKLSNWRPHENKPNLTIVDVACPNCGFTHTVAYAGWSAIGCPCGTDLARNKRSL